MNKKRKKNVAKYYFDVCIFEILWTSNIKLSKMSMSHTSCFHGCLLKGMAQRIHAPLQVTDLRMKHLGSGLPITRQKHQWTMTCMNMFELFEQFQLWMNYLIICKLTWVSDMSNLSASKSFPKNIRLWGQLRSMGARGALKGGVLACVAQGRSLHKCQAMATQTKCNDHV